MAQLFGHGVISSVKSNVCLSTLVQAIAYHVVHQYGALGALYGLSYLKLITACSRCGLSTEGDLIALRRRFVDYHPSPSRLDWPSISSKPSSIHLLCSIWVRLTLFNWS